ncbi:shikimate kinase [Chryseobacterium sp. SORGH_AS909]|uniref:hypothetical protein n=1 Tax=Chryseobacterium sp. SORGH_AS_0909 TaxID=3041759 RepID=UPI00285DE9C4|nr:hypothetical protein [Chryseobacterium sp. SORGH_AS_0909]MDR6084710.1 shikimate kinase [Chryseobacterium sp. SORGH_AS_0909]
MKALQNWILKTDQLKQLLTGPLATPIFISGCYSNQTYVYPLFDHVVLLSASLEKILRRVTGRTSNPYGKTVHERNEISWNFENIQPLLKKNISVELNTEMITVEEIATILKVLAGN